MSSSDHAPSSAGRPRRLLTQNREMRGIGVHNWSLPAWAGRLPDGRTYNTCPSAGICRHVCYARHGTYTWPAVRAWQAEVDAHRRTRGDAAVRPITSAPSARGRIVPETDERAA